MNSDHNNEAHEANDADIVFDQVFACVFSGLEFQTNSKIVFENIASNNQRYIDDALVSIYEVLVSPDCPPIAKFYALYLLVRATETSNLLLANQLSQYKDLLQKIFQDAQADKDKAFPEKGMSFFSKQPSQEEALIGANYIRLCLEALKFWSNSFGTPDKLSPLHMYTQMYTKLSERIKFPESFFYIGKIHQTTTDFHLKQETTRDKSLARQQSSPPKNAMEENSKVYQQVVACVQSGRDYKNNCKVIFDTLAQQKTPEYSQRLLASIIDVLESQDCSPKNKFYALYLLVQSTETKNAAFVSAVSQKKSLLNKFYKDAKAEGDKDQKVRGQTIFPTIAKTPEAATGRNYVNLLIEAIKYWDNTYGNVESTNSLSHFKTLYNSLAKLVQYPQSYSYVGQKLDPEGLRGAKSLSRIEIVADVPQSQEDLGGSMSKAQAAKNHVDACLASGKTFKANFSVIIDTLKENPPGYIDSLLKSVYEVVNNPQETPLRKFYAVFLLVKSTEVRNESLMNTLAGSRYLLNKIFQDGQYDKNRDFNDRGRSFFSKEPKHEEKVLGNCYVILVLEALVFWNTNYAKENKKDVGHIFKVMYDALSQKNFRFPAQNSYIGQDINTVLAEVDRRLAQTEAATPQKDRSLSPGLTSPPKVIPEAKSIPPIDKKAVEATLEKYEAAKSELKEMLVNNKEESGENEELLEYLVEDVKQIYGTDVQTHVDALVDNPDPDLNVYIDKILEEHEIVQNLTTHHDDYKNKKMSYSNFRSNALQTLGVIVPEEKPAPIVEQKLVNPAVRGLIEDVSGDGRKPTDNNVKTVDNQVETPEKEKEEVKSSNSLKKLTLKSPRKDKGPITFPMNSSPNKPNEEEQNIRTNTVGSELNESHKRNVEDPITVTDLPKGQDMQSFSFKESARESIPSHRGDKVLGSMHSESIQKNPPIKEEIPTIETFKSPAQSKKKISEESLNQSLRNIAQSISNTKAVELNKIEDSIKSAYTASGKKPPTFQPLKELKKKEDLEREIEQLKRERLELSRQTNTLRSQIMEGSRDEEDIQVASRILGGTESESNKPVVESYQQKIQDLQSRLDDTSIRLKHRENELSHLRKVAEGTTSEEVARMARENAELKIKVDQLSKDSSSSYQQSMNSSPEKRENRQLKNQVQELTQKNQTLLNAVESFKSPGRSREIDLLKVSNSPSPQKTTTGVSQTQSSGFTTNNSESKRERDILTGKEKVLEKGKYDVEHSRGFVMVSPQKSIRSEKYNASSKPSNEEFIIKGGSNSGQKNKSQTSSPPQQGAKRRREQNLNASEEQFEELKEIDKGRFGLFVDKGDLLNYKRSCLEEGSLLYEDEEIQVGVTSSLVYDDPKKKRVLRTVLYYGNKSDRNLERFEVDIGSGFRITHIVKNEPLEPKIYVNKQSKQQIISTINKVPYDCAQINGRFKSRGRDRAFIANLPCVVTKFMEFKPIDTESFEERWRLRSRFIFASKAARLDYQLVEHKSDFRKYFQHLVDVNQEEGFGLGGLFELDLPDVEYLLRIQIKNQDQVIFEIAGNDGDSQVAKFILDTLVFLFEA